MIHTNRIVTVGEQESIIDRPIVLYRGDREVEIEFTLVGNEFTFSEEGNVIKSVNASHGQLVLNTPSGEHMFSELAECHEGKVVFVVTKEMIDEFVEVGFYSFQIRLYDSAEMKSRVTIPPVMNGFDIRNPIAAEDETNVVDQGIVDYARIFKDQSNEELPTFDWTGAYNKTEWAHHDVITENKMNKIEDALYSINANVKESDVFMLNTLDKVKKDADKYVKEHMADVEADVEEFERDLNTDVQQFKIDTNAAMTAAMTAHKNEVSDVVDGFSGEIESINSQLEQIKNDVVIITNDLTIDEINEKLSLGGTFIFKNGNYLLDKSQKILPSSNSRLIFEPNAWIIYNDFTSTNYYMLEIYNCENVIVENANIRGCRDNHIGSDGEWGYGIHIVASKNIKIIKPYIEKTWGDGIYIGYKWDSSGSIFRTQNIYIQDAHIYKCSRNGIAICSGDDIFIDNCLIEETDRTLPKAGIDIEPENFYEDILHLSNVKITNVTTRNNTCGIGFALHRGYEGCNIIIDNHINYNNTPISWWDGGDLPCDVLISNSKYYNSSNYAFTIANKGAESNLTVTNVSIIGRSKTFDYDPLYNSAILVTGSTTEKKLGNITFDNVLISTKTGYEFSDAISVLNAEGNTSDISIKNITLSDFKFLGSSLKSYNFSKADTSTLKLKNIDASISSNYYLRTMSKSEYINEITYDKLVDYSYIDFNSNSLDGLYKFRLLDANEKVLTIRLSEDLTTKPNDAILWASDFKEFNIYKKGNTLYFL